MVKKATAPGSNSKAAQQQQLSPCAGGTVKPNRPPTEYEVRVYKVLRYDRTLYVTHSSTARALGTSFAHQCAFPIGPASGSSVGNISNRPYRAEPLHAMIHSCMHAHATWPVSLSPHQALINPELGGPHLTVLPLLLSCTLLHTPAHSCSCARPSPRAGCRPTGPWRVSCSHQPVLWARCAECDMWQRNACMLAGRQ